MWHCCCFGYVKIVFFFLVYLLTYFDHVLLGFGFQGSSIVVGAVGEVLNLCVSFSGSLVFVLFWVWFWSFISSLATGGDDKRSL